MKHIGKIRVSFFCSHCRIDYENKEADEIEIDEQTIAKAGCEKCGGEMIRYTKTNQKDDPYFRESEAVKRDIEENLGWFIELKKKNPNPYAEYEKQKESGERKAWEAKHKK